MNPTAARQSRSGRPRRGRRSRPSLPHSEPIRWVFRAPAELQLDKYPSYQELTFAQQKILRVVLGLMQETGETAISAPALATEKLASCSVRTVRRAFKAMSQSGLVEIYGGYNEVGGDHINRFQVGRLLLHLVRRDEPETRADVSPDNLSGLDQEQNQSPVETDINNLEGMRAGARETAKPGRDRTGERKRLASRGEGRLGARRHDSQAALLRQEHQQRGRILARMRETLAERQLCRADHIVLSQVAGLVPLEFCDDALLAARRTARWMECGAIGDTVRRKLVGLIRERGGTVPEPWCEIPTLEREPALDAERERDLAQPPQQSVVPRSEPAPPPNRQVRVAGVELSETLPSAGPPSASSAPGPDGAEHIHLGGYDDTVPESPPAGAPHRAAANKQGTDFDALVAKLGTQFDASTRHPSTAEQEAKRRDIQRQLAAMKAAEEEAARRTYVERIGEGGWGW